MFNLYTCTKKELVSLPDIGNASADKILLLREEVINGTQPPLTVQDLATVRLTEEVWQNFITEGKLSIEFPTVKVKGPNPVKEVLTEPSKSGQFEKILELIGSLDAKFEDNFGSLDAKFEYKLGILHTKMDTLSSSQDSKFVSISNSLDETCQEIKKRTDNQNL